MSVEHEIRAMNRRNVQQQLGEMVNRIRQPAHSAGLDQLQHLFPIIRPLLAYSTSCITLLCEYQFVDVLLVGSNRSPILAGCYLTNTRHASLDS